MPVIKSAKKKLRQDIKRQVQNKGVKNLLKSLFKKAHSERSEKSIIAAIQATDKAAKKHIIHKNKAARMKSSLSKLITKKQETKKADVKTKKSLKTKSKSKLQATV